MFGELSLRHIPVPGWTWIILIPPTKTRWTPWISCQALGLRNLLKLIDLFVFSIVDPFLGMISWVFWTRPPKCKSLKIHQNVFLASEWKPTCLPIPPAYQAQDMHLVGTTIFIQRLFQLISRCLHIIYTSQCWHIQAINTFAQWQHRVALRVWRKFNVREDPWHPRWSWQETAQPITQCCLLIIVLQGTCVHQKSATTKSLVHMCW